jgi:hypothetical protein
MGHVTCVREMKTDYRTFFSIHERKRPLERFKHRYTDIEMDLKRNKVVVGDPS